MRRPQFFLKVKNFFFTVNFDWEFMDLGLKIKILLKNFVSILLLDIHKRNIKVV